MNYSEISVDSPFKGQFIIFYVIFGLGILIYACFLSFHCGRFNDILYELKELKLDSEYAKYFTIPLASIISSLILFGPLIFIFNLSSQSDFKQGCFTFSLVHLFTNNIYIFIIITLLNIYFRLENFWIYSSKNNYFFKKWNYEELKTKCIFYIFSICLTFALGNIVFYFSKNYIQNCDEKNLKKEKIIYFLIIFISYFLLNWSISLKKCSSEGKTLNDLEEKYVFLKSLSIWLFSYNLMILYFFYKVEVGDISRKAFNTIILYFYFTLPISLIILCFWVIVDDYLKRKYDYFEETYVISRISYRRKRKENQYILDSGFEWKENEKNNMLKDKTGFFPLLNKFE